MSARARAREEVSAGGVVFRVCRGPDGRPEPLFLLIRDSYDNWGFPKGHLEAGEGASCAALREVCEETGLAGLAVEAEIQTIDWYFRFRGRLIHKVCHFFLMRTECAATCPQRSEGITACRWAPFEEAVAMISYANARDVLRRAHAIVAPLLLDGGSVAPVQLADGPAAMAPDADPAGWTGDAARPPLRSAASAHPGNPDAPLGR